MSHALLARRGRIAWSSVGAGVLAFGCLVPDIELVDDLPNGAAGSAGRAGASQSGSSNEGGEPTSEGGSESSAGQPSDGGAPGQSGAAGSALGGASGGRAGSGGSGGGSVSTEIPELDVCSGTTYQVCDDFEGALSAGWPAGVAGTPMTDAPSGDAVLVANYQFQPQLQLDFTTMSVSFWVRFQTKADQRFVSFAQGTDEFGLGMEHEQARFIHGGAEGIIAPTDDTKTRVLTPLTWICVQLRVDALMSVIDARIVVPGDAPVDLPPLDNTPTEGEDLNWHEQSGPPLIDSGHLTFGQEGAYQELDDVVVGEYDEATVCDRYLEAIAN
jgi:hypothetical protein